MNVEVLSWSDKVSLRQWVKSQSLNQNTFSSFFLKKFLSENSSPGEVWGAFQPISPEPSLDWSIASEFGIKLCFPKVLEHGIDFYSSNTFEKGAYGIAEPVLQTDESPISKDQQKNQSIKSEEIKGLFIPGLAFDNRGQRLGRGKGYYDSYLKNYRGLKVGLIWSKYFIQGAIPTDPWDIPVDFILTENFVYQPIKVKKQ